MANKKRTFVYLDAVSSTKDASVLQEPEFTKEYVPFVINHALSYHEDAVGAANLMNERPGLDPASQFRFLLNTLRARKRFSKWLKTTVSDDVRAVAEYYECSIRHARNLVSLHTPEQLTVVHNRLEKGGVASKRGFGNDST